MADQPGAMVPAQQTVPTKLVVNDDSPLSYMMDTAKFEHLYRIARVIAAASLTPKHLRGENVDVTVANCFRVVNQAMRWGMDPFSVVDATYVVSGKLGYEGKLVAAVVNARAGLKGRLNVEYKGSGKDRTAIITGQFADETKPRTIEISVEQAATSNQMWTKDPDQKLWYSGVTKWARRHCPDVMLGVMDEDDLERMKEQQIAEAMQGLHAAGDGDGNGNGNEPKLPPPNGRQNLRAPKTETQEPLASEQQHATITAMARQLNLTPENVNLVVSQAGATRLQKLTPSQADAVIAQLAKLQDEQGQDGDDGQGDLELQDLIADIDDRIKSAAHVNDLAVLIAELDQNKARIGEQRHAAAMAAVAAKKVELAPAGNGRAKPSKMF